MKARPALYLEVVQMARTDTLAGFPAQTSLSQGRTAPLSPIIGQECTETYMTDLSQAEPEAEALNASIILPRYVRCG